MALLLFFSTEDTFRSTGCKLQNRDFIFPLRCFSRKARSSKWGSRTTDNDFCVWDCVVKWSSWQIAMKTIALSDETIVLQTVLEVDNYTNCQLVCKNTTFFSEMLVSASLKSCFSLIACCLWLLYRLFANSLFQIQRFYVFSQGKSILHHWQVVCSPR